MASVVIELLLSRIASALDSEARLIAGLEDELRALQTELIWMRAFEEDVYRSNTTLTETQKALVDEVIDMAYIAETIIDEFVYHMSSQPNGSKLTKLFYGTVGFPKNLLERRRIARELQKMKRKIAGARERKQLYLEDRITGWQEQLRRQRLLQNYSESCLFFKDEDLVGTEAGRDKLLRWLTDEANRQRSVISVVGIGGSGKTTLVASVYRQQDVRRHFDCWAWITISQTYDVDNLLKGMIKEFHRAENQQVAVDLSIATHIELVETLVEYLRPKRYVIVLDDVWDVNLWSQISSSLPQEGHGSRVLITTRKQNIASSSFGVKSYVHHVEPLEKSQAWELFRMKAFSNDPNKSCPPGFQAIALQLVGKCEGLPLAIVALGGLMSSKNLEFSEWRRVLEGFNWELNNNPTLDRVKIVLLLSFHELSYRHKCCFLYCCLFPEDYIVEQERLTRLWMAEGFLETMKGIRPEDVAERYFVELVNRNMLQRHHEAYCKMHDVLREFALDISMNEKFCATYNGREAMEEITGSRRLSIQSAETDLRSWNRHMMKLCTLFVFPGSVKTLPHGLKLLRVLDLESIRTSKLPNEVVNLFNLRYLNLRESLVNELPKSIGRLRNLQTLDISYSNVQVLPKSIERLWNLQTLDISHSNIRVLPNGITKLHNLRNLFAIDSNAREYFEGFYYGSGVTAPANICKLKKLQILDGVEASPKLMKQARSMTQLTRLAIYNVKETMQEDLMNSIQSMKLLTHLVIRPSIEDEYLRMDMLSSAPPCLSVLELAGKLERVPAWLRSLESLTHLDLHFSRLREDPLPYIHALPNLGVLGFTSAYIGRQLCFSTGFCKLKVLELAHLEELSEIIIERGVMPSVQRLWLQECMQLKMLPRGIQFLTNLQTLELAQVSDELIQGVEREGSLDRKNLQHIPHIGYFDRDFKYRKVRCHLHLLSPKTYFIASLGSFLQHKR